MQPPDYAIGPISPSRKDPSPTRNRERQEPRPQRIAAIKAQVEAGTYAVDPLEISRRIIQRLIPKPGNR